MCTRYLIINRVSELKVHIKLTRFVQPEKIEIDANERAVNEKSPYCFFVCTTFDSFLNDLCNKHYGQRMLLITYEISKKLYSNKPLYLEVRTWNIRAIKCYQKAGFRIDGQAYELTTGIGTGIFYRMIRE